MELAIKALAAATKINALVGSDGISVMLITPTRIEKYQVFILGATPNNPALWDRDTIFTILSLFSITFPVNNYSDIYSVMLVLTKEKQSYRSSRSTQ